MTKRYRVIAAEFETRVLTLEPPESHLPAPERFLRQQHYERTLLLLRSEYGEFGFEAKLDNLRLLPSRPMSVVDFHNQCLEQCRQAFVCGQYYPVLTAAFALAERMLVHLVNGLRPRYCDKSSKHILYAWEQKQDAYMALELLLAWQVIRSEVADLWLELQVGLKNRLYANNEDLLYKRELAFEVLTQVEDIISQQFAGAGDLPWLFAVNDEYYIRKEFEQHPFIQLVYLPSSVYLGPRHQIKRVFPWEFTDIEDDIEHDGSDEEFAKLRLEFCRRTLSTAHTSTTV